MGVCNCSMFCCTLLYVHSSIAIILMGKRELVALLNLSSMCLVMVERLFLARCYGVVCGLWLWYFLIIITYYFGLFVLMLYDTVKKIYSHGGTCYCLLGWNSTKQRIKCLISASGESQTSDPSVPSITLYHWAPRLFELMLYSSWCFTSQSTIFQSCLGISCVESVLNSGKVVLLKNTIQCICRGSNQQPYFFLYLKSRPLTLSHWMWN